MKKLLILASLLVLGVSQNAFSRTYYLVNSTPFEVEFNVHYLSAFCKQDTGVKVAPYDTQKINAGGCSITSVDAKVYQSMTGGQQVEGISSQTAVEVGDKFSGTSISSTWIVYAVRDSDRKMGYRLTNQGLPKTIGCQ